MAVDNQEAFFPLFPRVGGSNHVTWWYHHWAGTMIGLNF
jgi:hypothetical protein